MLVLSFAILASLIQSGTQVPVTVKLTTDSQSQQVFQSNVELGGDWVFRYTQGHLMKCVNATTSMTGTVATVKAHECVSDDLIFKGGFQ